MGIFKEEQFLKLMNGIEIVKLYQFLNPKINSEIIQKEMASPITYTLLFKTKQNNKTLNTQIYLSYKEPDCCLLN